MLGIDNLELLEVLNAFHPLLLHLRDVVVSVVKTLENFFMTCLVGSILLCEVVENVAYTQTITTGLVGVSRANAFTRRANLVLALSCFVSCIEQTVGWHDEVCLLRNVETVLQIVTALLQILGLIHKEVGGKHHAVTDNVHFVTLENARWNGTKHILLSLKFERVSCVRTSLETGYNVIAWRQNIHDLTLTLVSPLKT